MKVARLQLLTTRIRTDFCRRPRVDPGLMPRDLNLSVDGKQHPTLVRPQECLDAVMDWLRRR